MLHSFSLRRVNALRRAAARASTFPEEGPYGWRKSPVDPAALLGAFGPLRLKPGFVLRAYHFREGGNANGFVYALPADAPFPEPEECDQHGEHFLEPPIPPGALPDVMKAIDGDRSAWSYLCASIFARELTEFGAWWHGCEWSTHKILGDAPLTDSPADGDEAPEPWQWIEPAPENWLPTVVMGDPIQVRFFTHTRLGSERVTRYIDDYGRHSNCADRVPLGAGRSRMIRASLPCKQSGGKLQTLWLQRRQPG